MVAVLTCLCIFGAFVLGWRRAALTGYFGGGRGNLPGIFEYALGNLLVLLVGLLAYWGTGLLIFLFAGWQWAGLALLLGFALRLPLLRLVCGPPGGRVPNSPTDPLLPATRPRQQVPKERTLPHDLHELKSGISIDRALELFVNACNKPGTMFITEKWLGPRLTELRRLLSDPISADQAEALRDAILERCPLKEVLGWLEVHSTGWRDYQARKNWLEEESRRLAGQLTRDHLKLMTQEEKASLSVLQGRRVHMDFGNDILLRPPEANERGYCRADVLYLVARIPRPYKIFSSPDREHWTFHSSIKTTQDERQFAHLTEDNRFYRVSI